METFVEVLIFVAPLAFAVAAVLLAVWIGYLRGE